MEIEKIPILEVDPAGIEHFADCEYDVHAVFLDFPNAAEQKRRLLEREPHISPEELDTRLSQAAQERAWALSQASAGHLIIAVNDKLGACVQEVSSALDILN
jgi:guanylate kinase